MIRSTSQRRADQPFAAGGDGEDPRPRRDGASLLEVVAREDETADKEIGRRWVTTPEPARYYIPPKGRLAKKEEADPAAIAEMAFCRSCSPNITGITDIAITKLDVLDAFAVVAPPQKVVGAVKARYAGLVDRLSLALDFLPEDQRRAAMEELQQS